MRLHLNTVTNLLWTTLQKLMSIEEFNSFRLVGGTSLSLQLGHRESVDIDLFCDSEYGSIDFVELEHILSVTFPYVNSVFSGPVAMGKSFFVGNNEKELVKLDLYYTDSFVFPVVIQEKITFASLEEVSAMKFDIIARGGRKKDFWDVHELLEKYSLDELIEFYIKRYPYGSPHDEIIIQLRDFSVAEDDFTPNCFRGKDWEIIKLDFEDLVEKYK